MKIELNPGGVGVRLDKLAKVSAEVEKFVRLLAADSGATPQPGELLVKDFYDGSFGGVIEYVHNVERASADKFNTGLRFFSDFKGGQYINGEFSPATVRQFIELGSAIDVDEVVKLGIIDPDKPADSAEWKSITKLTTLNIDAAYNVEFKYEGALQGKLGTWYKDSNYFNLRELSTRELVKCFYKAEIYDQIYRLFEDKDAVVNIAGTITADRATGHIREIRASWARSYAPLSRQEFDRLFGLDPDLTGDQKTSDYIEQVRNGDSENLH